MTGFNMPPGVSTRDIPGNDAPDPSPESEKILDLLESAEGRCPPQYYCDKIIEIVEQLVEERNDYKARLTDLQIRLSCALEVSDLGLMKRQAE